MVQLIMGRKGSGKTKQLIEQINNAAKDEAGSVVCIEADPTMTYDIHYHIRHIAANEYNLHGAQMLQGFLCGLYAGNYDISYIFIDNLLKLLGTGIGAETDRFLAWLEKFSTDNSIKFTATVSEDQSSVTEAMKKFL